MATTSRFIAEVAHPESCIGCGECAKICQMEAVSFGEEGVGISGAACIGCGQCAASCPQQVIGMKVKPGAPNGPSRETQNRIYL